MDKYRQENPEIKVETEIKKVNLLNDYAFKKSLGTPGQESSLESFINAVLLNNGQEPICDPQFVGGELNPNTINEKASRLDILAKTKDRKELVNVEVQVERTDDMLRRSNFYEAKVITQEQAIAKGEKYASIPRIITINLLGYVDGRFHPEEFHTQIIPVEAKHRERIHDFSQLNFLELPNFRKLKPDLNNALHRWLVYLDPKSDEQIRMEVLNMDPQIRHAEQAATSILSNPKELEAYRSREKYEMDMASAAAYNRDLGLEEGLSKGREEGENKKVREIAMNSFALNLPLDIIIKLTGLQEDEVAVLWNEYLTCRDK